MSGSLFMGVAWMMSTLFANSEQIDLEQLVSGLTPLEITEQVTTSLIKPLSHTNYSVKELIEHKTQLDDHAREFKDLSTDIVVKLFLASDRSMFNFLKLIYETFNDSLSRYKELRHLEKWDIFFVYKGGNVLRIITNDFLKELPKLASRKFNQYYEKFFKRSDADFSIYIKPTLTNYDQIYLELTTLSYLLQVKIRQEFMSNLTKYFDYFKYNTEYQIELLRYYHEQAANAKSLRDPNNPKFYKKRFDGIVICDAGTLNQPCSGLPDKGIQFASPVDAGQGSQKIIYQITPNDNMMYIQSNETLDFPAADNRTKFNLVRTKLSVNYYFDGQLEVIGGELIDVSIPHKFDGNVQHFFEHTNYISQYQLNLVSSETLTFRSYTLTYLISDLEYILFKFVSLPWNTPKYEKRVNRLFYLYVIDLFVRLKTLSARKQVIESIKKLFAIRLTDISDLSRLSAAATQLSLRSDLEIGKLLDEIVSICDYLKLEGSAPEDLENFNEMIDVLRVNCEFALTVFEGITDYCSNEGNVNMRVLYQNEFSSLI